jgi:hypothetical protein
VRTSVVRFSTILGPEFVLRGPCFWVARTRRRARRLSYRIVVFWLDSGLPEYVVRKEHRTTFGVRRPVTYRAPLIQDRSGRASCNSRAFRSPTRKETAARLRREKHGELLKHDVGERPCSRDYSLSAFCRVDSFRWLVHPPNLAAPQLAGQPLDIPAVPLAHGIRAFIPEHRHHRLL